jgi:hypothetical protein
VHGTAESRAYASAQQQEIPAPGLTHFMSSAVIDSVTPSAQGRVGLGQEADHAAL